MKRRKFTLIEMLVVLCIIGILMSLFLVGVQHAINAGKRTKFLGEVASIRAALDQYKNKNGYYPTCQSGSADVALDDTICSAIGLGTLATAIKSPWETAVTSMIDGNNDGVVNTGDPAEDIPQSCAIWTKDNNNKVIKSWE